MHSKRIFKKIDEGSETDVYKHSREGRQGKTVVKPFGKEPTWDEDGNVMDINIQLNAAVRDTLNNRHAALRRQYNRDGHELILRQRIIPRKDAPGLYVLVQEMVQDARDLFSISDEVVDPDFRAVIENLLSQLKSSLSRLFEQGKKSDNVLLDLFGGKNLLVSGDEKISYVDTGFGLDWGHEEDTADILLNQADARHSYLNKIAYLETLLGRSAHEIFSDPFYDRDYVAHLIVPVKEGEKTLDLPHEMVAAEKKEQLEFFAFTDEEVNGPWGLREMSAAKLRKHLGYAMAFDDHLR